MEQISALTEAQVAERLSVSAATLRNWRRRGIGPKYCRFGRAVRYMSEDVDEFVRAAGGPSVDLGESCRHGAKSKAVG